jgi:uncharacterized membrane protein YgcG
VNTQPAPVGKILQLLLRCGMVCQEELNVVLEMMQAVQEPCSMPSQKQIAPSTQRSGSGGSSTEGGSSGRPGTDSSYGDPDATKSPGLPV